MRVGVVGDGRMEPGFGSSESDLQSYESQFHVLDFDRLGIDQTSFAWNNLMGQSENTLWTPTLTNTTNLDSSSVLEAFYIDLGQIVLCYVDFVANATATGLAVLDMTIPIDAVFADTNYLAGAAASHEVAEAVRISANVNGNQARLRWIASSTGNVSFSGHFAYRKG